MNALRFDDPRDDYGRLSNFSRHPIALDGKDWPTVEHYYQAQKFFGADRADVIRQAPTPRAAAPLI